MEDVRLVLFWFLVIVSIEISFLFLINYIVNIDLLYIYIVWWDKWFFINLILVILKEIFVVL